MSPIGQIMRLYRCGLPLMAELASVVFGLAGCGSRGGLVSSTVEQCPPGSAACLSELVGQICNQQGQWATFQCPNTQVCQDKTCVTTKEPCSPGTTQCLSNQVSQICDPQGQWATFTCASSQVCRDNTCVASKVPCSVGTTQCLTTQIVQTCIEDGKWFTSACEAGQSCKDGNCHSNAACTPNAHECVADRTQRICLGDGSSWVTSECPDGFKCKDGECIGSCNPGSKMCAATRVVRECRTDGSGYVEHECLTGMTCEKGVCVPDLTAACSAGNDNTCRDEQTAVVCKLDGSGFELKTCTNGTKCRWGACVGSTCAVGETVCTEKDVLNLVGVQTCSADGSGYTVSMCRALEDCVYNQTTAHHECYLPPCVENKTTCGDPTGNHSSGDRMSRCETLDNGRLGWVSYLCSSPSACTVNDDGEAACYADCAPGDRRCSDDDTAIESCGEDGKWSSKSCNELGSGILACVVVPTNNKVVCGDADCGALEYDLETYQTRGRCSAEKIRKCGDDGKLQLAVTCDEGMCLPESDGFGICKDPNRCDQAEGWRECATEGGAYRTCQSHHWEFTLCASGEACTDNAQGHAACGDACAPGARRCSGPDYQLCSDKGVWGPNVACTSGECNPTTTLCEVVCQPGDIRCVGDVSLASDGTTLGSSAMQTCQSNGRWGTSQACVASAGQAQHCRRSGNGVHIGCVACIGESVPGGNEENSVDSRCSVDSSGRQTCLSSNTWPTTVEACAASEQCVKTRDGTIRGTCSDNGCSSNSSRRCLGFQLLATPETISDCCAGDCLSATGECLHRQSQYDPSCLDSSSCFTGRHDTDGAEIYETCCSGFCKYGEGCLRIKAQPCASVTSCEVERLGRVNVCCGTCQTDGSCLKGQEAEHPVGEYFTCSSTSYLCWSIGSCSWYPGDRTGAAYADCQDKPDGG